MQWPANSTIENIWSQTNETVGRTDKVKRQCIETFPDFLLIMLAGEPRRFLPAAHRGHYALPAERTTILTVAHYFLSQFTSWRSHDTGPTISYATCHFYQGRGFLLLHMYLQVERKFFIFRGGIFLTGVPFSIRLHCLSGQDRFVALHPRFSEVVLNKG